MNEPWFRHNRRGFGPGLPVHRNGWIALGAYVALLILFPWPLEYFLGYPPGTVARFLTILALSTAFGIVAYFKTEGGWGRRGGREN